MTDEMSRVLNGEREIAAEERRQIVLYGLTGRGELPGWYAQLRAYQAAADVLRISVFEATKLSDIAVRAALSIAEAEHDASRALAEKSGRGFGVRRSA